MLCALFIPEVYFVNKAMMEPIKLDRIPPEKYNKVRTLARLLLPESVN